jgi:hypothetical protein
MNRDWTFNESIAEHFVPAGVPFSLEAIGVAHRIRGDTAMCPKEQHLYIFEENKDYEAYIGMKYKYIGMNSKMQPQEEGKCHFVVYQLPSTPQEANSFQNSPMNFRKNILSPLPVPENQCNDKK